MQLKVNFAISLSRLNRSLLGALPKNSPCTKYFSPQDPAQISQRAGGVLCTLVVITIIPRCNQSKLVSQVSCLCEFQPTIGGGAEGHQGHPPQGGQGGRYQTENKESIVLKVNVDEDPELAKLFSVNSFPKLMIWSKRFHFCKLKSKQMSLSGGEIRCQPTCSPSTALMTSEWASQLGEFNGQGGLHHYRESKAKKY